MESLSVIVVVFAMHLPFKYHSVNFVAAWKRTTNEHRVDWLESSYEAIRFFKYILEARAFVIKTDKKPFIYSFSQKPEKASLYQLRHLDLISQYSRNIVHVADNTVVDASPRLSAISMPTAITQEKIKERPITTTVIYKIYY